MSVKQISNNICIYIYYGVLLCYIVPLDTFHYLLTTNLFVHQGQNNVILVIFGVK
jgi:hypothetical protein